MKYRYELIIDSDEKPTEDELLECTNFIIDECYADEVTIQRI